MSAVLLRPEMLSVKDRGGGIRTRPMVTAKVGSRQMLNGVTVIDPGCAVPLHFHNCEESVLVLSGAGRAHIDGEEHDVRPRDLTWIPAGVPHFFRNVSESVPLEIFWTYASLDATRTVVATGVVIRIDEEHGER
ncbi:cupin domain-containing protein [Sphingosinicella microcystinivorans]|uniref:Cupin n=1 Tax=Sphingosinicella microcystinivorans TaxID=335406 RepID=A0AAD1D484_SPHMI|nr:cupin domain-containing protein [Sphingosinicella microcystinivorans]RKS90604.1 cupin domain [Sphingosinicella microcystinivorans]BBE33518.1 cupin [Sphingosinicella microcystinivorans]